MKKRSRSYPRVRVDTADVPAVGQAGGVSSTGSDGGSVLTLPLAHAGEHVACQLHQVERVDADRGVWQVLAQCLAEGSRRVDGDDLHGVPPGR